MEDLLEEGQDNVVMLDSHRNSHYNYNYTYSNNNHTISRNTYKYQSNSGLSGSARKEDPNGVNTTYNYNIIEQQ